MSDDAVVYTQLFFVLLYLFSARHLFKKAALSFWEILLMITAGMASGYSFGFAWNLERTADGGYLIPEDPQSFIFLGIFVLTGFLFAGIVAEVTFRILSRKSTK